MRFLGTILFLMPVVALAQDADVFERTNLPPINITNAVESAVTAHPQAQIAVKNIDLAKQDMRAAQADLLPTGTANYSYGPSENPILLGPGLAMGGLAGVTADQPVFSLPSIYAYQAAKERLRAAASAADNDLLKIAATAMTSYLDVLKLRITLCFSKENYFYLTALIEAMKKGDLKGKAKVDDINLAQGSLGSSLSDKHIWIQQEEIAELRFDRDTRLSAKENFLNEPYPLPIPDNADLAVEIATRANPGLEAAKKRIEAVKKDVKADRAQHLPRVDIFANAYDYHRPAGDFSQYYIHGGAVGASISYTFDFKKRTVTAKDKTKEEIAELTYDDQFNNTDTSIRSIYVQCKERRIRLQGLCQGLKERMWTVDSMRKKLISGVSVQDFLFQKDALLKNAVSLDNEFLSEVLDSYNVHVQMGTLMNNLPPPIDTSKPSGPNPVLRGDEIYKDLLNRCETRKLI